MIMGTDKQPDEEAHRARYVYDLRALPLPDSPHVPQPGSSLNPVLWVFMEASLQT